MRTWQPGTSARLLLLPLATLTLLIGCDDGPEYRDSVVVFETDFGTFEATLDQMGTPETTQNFRCLVKHGYYNGRLIHRIVPGFVIQGGAADSTGRGGETCNGEVLQDEHNWNLTFGDAWTLGMAKSGAPNSASSQFFITLDSFETLDNQGYAAFGRITTGTDVVREISEVPLEDMPGGIERSRPVDPVVLRRVWIRGVK